MEFCKPAAYKSINSNSIEIISKENETYDPYQFIVDESTNVFNDILESIKGLFIA